MSEAPALSNRKEAILKSSMVDAGLLQYEERTFMAASSAKFVILIAASVALLIMFLILQQSNFLNMNTQIEQQWSQFSPEEKTLKWERCKKLITGKAKMKRTSNSKTDSEILDSYNPNDDCFRVLKTRFAHPLVTKEEQGLPIAFGFSVHKDARLFERILQAIYMPNNVYCIHIDKKSPEVFRRAIQAMIRCLPNVFISSKSADVVWGHFSIVQAQLNCMEELLESSVKWKYYINLVGQDFPLYENSQIVVALQKLNSFNSLESFPMPEHNKDRTKYVHTLTNYALYNTGIAKPPPPHNIPIHKGSTHIVAIREFVEFVLHSKIGKDFIEFLNDSYVPDETIYASLQQHPLAPGGIRGEQPEHISRALRWYDQYPECHGKWVRTLCWLSIEDLHWALGAVMKEKLFVHKIPFDYNDDLLECILVARQGRKYNTTVWKAEKRAQWKETKIYRKSVAKVRRVS